MTSADEQGPANRPRLEARGLSEAVENFTRHLVELGHTPLTVSGYEAGARHFGDWLHRSGISPDQIDDKVVDQFAHHQCCCPGIRRCSVLSAHYAARVRRFVVFLAEAGIIKPPSSSRPPVNIRIVAFQTWLREHRGLSEQTIDRNGRMVARLLLALGDDPASYDAALVRRVILDEVRKSSVSYVKTMTTALRGYLNFLATRGECRPGLGRAIPTVPQWRLSALPRYLPAEDVERLIAACDPDTPSRIRDRAILLLLARLGLRAGDILDMKLDDIDWAVGTLRVSVFRRAKLTHLSGGSASKIDPLKLLLVGCLLSQEAGGGDADCGDDWPDTAGSPGQGEVDPRDRP